MRVLTALLLLMAASSAFAAPENLDEVSARKSRLSGATWGYSLLQNNADSYTWQPETLAYSDAATGNEVWRVTYAPGVRNVTQDIGSAHWSANGKRVVFASNRQNAARPTATTADYTWFLMNTDGSRMRPGVSLSNWNWNWSQYPAWNPAVADTLYLPGNGTAGSNYYTLYSNSITDTTTSKAAVVNIDSSVTRRIYLKKGIAADGSRLFFSDLGRFVGFVADLKTNSLLTEAAGYSQNFPLDAYWGNTEATSSYTTWHDNYVTGGVNTTGGIWTYFMQAGTSSWWRARLTATGGTGAPTHIQDHTAPYVWGEIEPVNTIVSESSPLNDPWAQTDYVSHFTPDRWGKYGIFTKSGSTPYGTSLIDLSSHGYWNAAQAFSGASVPWVQHHDWEAWSDWSISSGSPDVGSDYSIHRVTAQNYKTPASQKVLCLTHSLYNSGGVYANDYYTLPRPTQSPDGTKAMFNSTFLNASDNDVQLFWTVAYYPYPPEIKSAAKNGVNVRLTWDFNQGSVGSPNYSTPRTYATRGWPNETTDLPPSPREIDKFRVWVSSDNATWTPAGTVTYSNCRGTNECGAWTESAWTFDYAQPVSATRYYAVTSVEHSRLESHKLGNVWKVITDGSGNVTTSAQQTAYPTDPGGRSTFYSTKPAAVSYSAAGTGTAGQYRVNWSEPADTSLIRHYNIYAKDGSAPTATQQSRIASVPVGTATYLDWLGNTDGSTQYLVTAVDYQGNESSVSSPAPTAHSLGSFSICGSIQ